MSGVLLVVSGPSGAGKGAIVSRLLEREPGVWRSISATTRPRRDGEIDGFDYQFLDREAFEALRGSGGFLESFEVFDNLYGTPRGPVDAHLAAGEDVLLEIDVQGAMAVRRFFPEAVLVFIRPPSREIQRERLVSRGLDDPGIIERRLAQAAAEEAFAPEFDEIVVNNDLEQAVRDVAAILVRRRKAPSAPTS